MSVYKQRNGKAWTIDYTVNGKRVRETVAVGDKVLAERILGQRPEQAHKVSEGLADPFLGQNNRPLSEHVASLAEIPDALVRSIQAIDAVKA